MSKARIGGIAAIVLGVLALATRGYWLRGAPAANPTVAAMIADGRREFSRLSMIPAETLDAQSMLEHVTERAQTKGAWPSDVGARADVLREFSEFFIRRYVRPNASEYIAWRKAAGYVPREYGEFDKIWGVGDDYTALFKQPPPARDTAALFPKFFDLGLTMGNGAAKPVGVSGEPNGIIVAVGEVRHEGQPRPSLSTGIPESLWHGKTAGTPRCWWEPKHKWESILKRDHRVVWVEIGIIMEFADGYRRPLVHSYYWDPRDRRWILGTINNYNDDMTRVTALEY